MKKPRQESQERGVFESSEDAELAFYKAFAECDALAMERVWAQDEVICIHPGATLLRGRAAVLTSWTQIFSGASKPSIRIKTVKRLQQGELAIHVVEEHITPGDASNASPSVILATNVFRRIDGVWYLAEHHASLPLVNTDTDQPRGSLH